MNLGSVAWGDYDSDGDLDILLTGWNAAEIPIAYVYRNNGGIFNNAGAGLDGVLDGSVAWGDYDRDGDLDILLTGDTGSGYIAKIYRNDEGSFIEDTAAETGLPGIVHGSVAWGDCEPDGDLDILFSGDTGSGYISEIYLNDGEGLFAAAGSTGLTGVYMGSNAWGDYDSDGDLDVLLTGQSSTGPVSRVYRNNGAATFSIAASLNSVYGSSVGWGDYDSDGDLDILLTGFNGSANVSKVYENNSGAFPEYGAGLTAVASGSAAWGGYDTDTDLDILLTGSDSLGSPVGEIYENQSTAANTAPSVPSDLSAVVSPDEATLSWSASTDTETDPDSLTYNLRVGTSPGGQDIVSPMADSSGQRLLPQMGNAGQRTSHTLELDPGTYFWSVQAIDNSFAGSAFATSEGVFTIGFEDIGAPLSGVYSSSAAWGDYDGDDDLDLLLTGDTYSSCIGEIYQNAGSNTFELDVGNSAEIADVCLGSAVWGDYDSDGDLDILLTGGGAGGRVAKIYRNDAGSFEEDTGASGGLTGVDYSSAAWGDYDSDGDLDILLSGREVAPGWDFVTKLYPNDDGDFELDPAGSGLTGISGSLAWGDYDSDGDLDIILAGLTSSSADSAIIKIYENDAGSFTFDSDASDDLAPVSGDSVAWGDYDSDGDLDLLLTGWDETGHARISRIYRNSNGSFSDIGAGLTGFDASSAAWGDHDSDGDLDIVLAGDSGAGYLSKIFRNEGSGDFTDIGANLTGAYDGSAAWGDYNRDGHLDLVLAGWNDPNPSGFAESKIYRNDLGIANTTPSNPSNLGSVVDVEDVTLSWDAAGDSQTSSAGLTYNVYVKSDPNHNCGGPYIVSPMTSAGGYRHLPAWGNAGELESFALENLPGGYYCWSVQAIDNNFDGSPFASPYTFRIPSNFSISSEYQIGEAGPSVEITISRTGSPIGQDSVRLTTADGSANAGWDYVAVDEVLTFVPGDMEETVSIPIVNDNVVEFDETISLALSDPSVGASLGYPREGTITIQNNDLATIEFSSAGYQSGEGSGAAQISVVCSGDLAHAVFVHLATSAGGTAGTSDYTAFSEDVFFPSCAGAQTVSIPIADDQSDEPDETVQMTLSSPSAGATLGGRNSAVLTIVDNDAAGTTPQNGGGTAQKGKIVSAKLSKKSFAAAAAAKARLTVKFSPKSKVFRSLLSIKKGKKWVKVKAIVRRGSLGSYKTTVKKLFGGKKIKPGLYRLKLSADVGSRTLSFKVI